jgi:hypothetical protein
MHIPEASDVKKAVGWGVGTLVLLTQLVITVLAAVASVIT